MGTAATTGVKMTTGVQTKVEAGITGSLVLPAPITEGGGGVTSVTGDGGGGDVGDQDGGGGDGAATTPVGGSPAGHRVSAARSASVVRLHSP